jgi:hypothetical protein
MFHRRHIGVWRGDRASKLANIVDIFQWLI